jgi:hypothetical protein
MLRLSLRERRLRRQMLDSYASQAASLRRMTDRGWERYRPAPRYDFARAPHPGALHYELLGFEMSGERWRELAAQAVDAEEATRDEGDERRAGEGASGCDSVS